MLSPPASRPCSRLLSHPCSPLPPVNNSFNLPACSPLLYVLILLGSLPPFLTFVVCHPLFPQSLLTEWLLRIKVDERASCTNEVSHLPSLFPAHPPLPCELAAVLQCTPSPHPPFHSLLSHLLLLQAPSACRVSFGMPARGPCCAHSEDTPLEIIGRCICTLEVITEYSTASSTPRSYLRVGEH